MRTALPYALFPCAILLLSTAAKAQPVEADRPDQVGVAQTEEPDPTRLDVARLPPEAAKFDRDLYARGFYVDGVFGARGFVGDLADVANPGPMLTLGTGYEFASWFAAGIAFSGSMHTTHNRPPPSQTAFESIEGLGVLRFFAPLSAQAGLRFDVEGGFIRTTGDVLQTLGFPGAHAASGSVGGAVAFDWHARSRHHSFGLQAGSRWLPLFNDSFALHGGAYVHYVF